MTKIDEHAGYHEGASVVCVSPHYKGMERKIGIISSIMPYVTKYPYSVTFTDGRTLPQNKEEVIPLCWYLMIRKEAFNGEFGDSSPSSRCVEPDF